MAVLFAGIANAQAPSPDSLAQAFIGPYLADNGGLPFKPKNEKRGNKDSIGISANQLSDFRTLISFENTYYENPEQGPYPSVVYSLLKAQTSVTVKKYPFRLGGMVTAINGRTRTELSSLDVSFDKERLVSEYKNTLTNRVDQAKKGYLNSLLPGCSFMKDSLKCLDSLQSFLKSKTRSAATQYAEYLKDSLRKFGNTLTTRYSKVDSCVVRQRVLKERYVSLLEYRDRYVAIVKDHKNDLARYDSILLEIKDASNVNGLLNASNHFPGLAGFSLPKFSPSDFVDGFDIGTISLSENELLLRNFSGNGVDFEYNKNRVILHTALGWEKRFAARMLDYRQIGGFSSIPDRKIAYAAIGLGDEETQTLLHALGGKWRSQSGSLLSGENLVLGLTDERKLGDALSIKTVLATSAKWPLSPSENSGVLTDANATAGSVKFNYHAVGLRTSFLGSVQRIGASYYSIGNPYLIRGVTEGSLEQRTRLRPWLSLSNGMTYKIFDKSLYSAFGQSMRKKSQADVTIGENLITSVAYETENLRSRTDAGKMTRRSWTVMQIIQTKVINMASTTTLGFVDNDLHSVSFGSNHARIVSLTEAVSGSVVTVMASYMLTLLGDTVNNQSATAGLSLTLFKKLSVTQRATASRNVSGWAYLLDNTVAYAVNRHLDITAEISDKYFSNPYLAFGYGSPYVALTVLGKF